MPEFSVYASALNSDWQLTQPEFDGLCVAANSGGAIGATDLLALYKDPEVDRLPRAMMSAHLSRCVALHSAYEYGLTVRRSCCTGCVTRCVHRGWMGGMPPRQLKHMV